MAKTRPRRKARGLRAKAPQNGVAEIGKEVRMSEEEDDWKWVLKSNEWGEEWRGRGRMGKAGKGVGLQRKAREEERGGEVRRIEKPMREREDFFAMVMMWGGTLGFANKLGKMLPSNQLHLPLSSGFL